MSDKELIKEMLGKYADLQRIEKAQDPKKEIANQKRFLEAQLRAFGIVTEDLQID